MKTTTTFFLSNDNLGATAVDNLFINEYMPRARGDYVKLYLYGLKNARSGAPAAIDNQALAQLFNITEGDVLNAWEYWKNEGIIALDRDTAGETRITFFHLPSMMLGGESVRVNTDNAAQTETEKAIAQMYSDIEELYGSRTVPREDVMTFKRWVTEDGFEPAAVTYLVQYTLEIIRQKDKPFSASQTLRYMSAIADRWHRSGIHTLDKAQKYVAQSRGMKKEVYRIMKKLGLYRDPMESERKMILSWFNTLGFDSQMIDLALSRTAKPNFKYINSILQRWHDSGLTTPEAVLAHEKAQPARYPKNNAPASQHIDPDRLKAYDILDENDERWLMEQ